MLLFLHFLLFKFTLFLPHPPLLLIINHPLSLAIFNINLLLTIIGFIYLLNFYRRVVRTVFNAQIPPLFTDSSFLSFYSIFLLARPLSICWRYSTYKFRLKPNLLIIGEVRCGTTTISQHISEMPGCHKPFCPWKHPELDGKETFYFVGHFDTTSPKHYNVCFPLKITKWFHTKILRRPFFTFDGCAQYLTSPTAPVLVADAFRGEEPPIIIGMVREPIEQTVSWWKFENAAMNWGKSMGLTSPNISLRTKQYWSKSIGEALKFSFNPLTEAAYVAAEGTVTQMDKGKLERFRLPDWAITWPNGQLTGIGRNGKFSENVARWEKAFNKAFGGTEIGNPMGGGAYRGRRYVDVVCLKELNDKVTLSALLKRLARRLRLYEDRLKSEKMELDVDFYVEKTLDRGLRRNRGGGGAEGISPSDLILLRSHFEGEKEKLECVSGRQIIF
ncbi:hypothetical protein TL16_g06844 [Triparma laevis f. inornata]|uniref:Sulfotransferase n=1 Tax=Triparma laevis f. inornata TaxID=1714386 RepID=A0A9W7ANX1_9STRA|nr:hypothetical protein TL16_g06844 [Triparma laevis f. inornata]